MANYRLLFAVLFVLLLFFSGYLLISNNAKQGRVDDAEQLSRNVYRYLQLNDVRCSTRPTDFEEINGCVEEEIEEMRGIGEMEIDEFEDYDSETNESGYIILVNEGQQTLASANFTLLKNGNPVDQGCAIQNPIEPGYTCKLYFNTTCETGDVLDPKYNEKSVLEDPKRC